MKKKVVVIGGGFAGSYIARKLQGKFDLTLIDNKDYFEFTPSILRTIVEPRHACKIQVLHKYYLSKANIVRGEVTKFNDKAAYIGKRRLEYDYLVICSGSKYNMPIKEQNLVIGILYLEPEQINK